MEQEEPSFQVHLHTCVVHFFGVNGKRMAVEIIEEMIEVDKYARQERNDPARYGPEEGPDNNTDDARDGDMC